MRLSFSKGGYKEVTLFLGEGDYDEVDSFSKERVNCLEMGFIPPFGKGRAGGIL